MHENDCGRDRTQHLLFSHAFNTQHHLHHMSFVHPHSQNKTKKITTKPTPKGSKSRHVWFKPNPLPSLSFTFMQTNMSVNSTQL